MNDEPVEPQKVVISLLKMEMNFCHRMLTAEGVPLFVPSSIGASDLLSARLGFYIKSKRETKKEGA